jgi:Rab3 GTPase-activating protein regulatory subunit N-terminus
MSVPGTSFDCLDLLEHVTREEEKLGRNPADINMGHFGHPPAPKLSMFRFRQSGDDKEDCVLMVAMTKRCISAQVLTRQSWKSRDSDVSATGNKTQGPFLVTKLFRQQQQQSIEETITNLTMAALEDLSFITATENHSSSVVLDDDPRKKKLQCDEATTIGTPDQATAKIKNLQMRGFVSKERVYLPRVAVIFGTNLSRVLSVELRFSAETQSIVLPLSDHLDPLPLDPLHLLKKIQDENLLPFCPAGGVNQLATFAITQQQRRGLEKAKKQQPNHPMAYVWISYGDGTILRIHHAAFFQSAVGDELLATPRSSDSVLLVPTKPALHERLNMQQIPLLLRCETKISKKDVTSFSIVPFPKHHPSPLAPLPPFKPPLEKNECAPIAEMLSDQEDKEENHDEDEVPEICEAVLYAKPTAAAGTVDIFPTLCFYTSEDQFLGRAEGNGGRAAPSTSFTDTPILGAMVGGTKAVVGGLVGALAWGFGSSAPAPAQAQSSDGDKQGEKPTLVPAGCFPSLRKSAALVKLYAGYELHDSPRQVESFIVDPEGNLGATTDTFGRVILIELSTKQVVRMWKGFREASCCWLEVPRPSVNSDVTQPLRKSLFLVIHSRQRRIVEVYRVRHGPRVKALQVGRDAQVVSCSEWSSHAHGVGAYLTTCYIVHGNAAGANTSRVLEKLVLQESEESAAREESQKSKQSTLSSSSTNPKEAALRLQRLQQLLANTNVPCQLADVHNALMQIKSLKDLATCLDRLAVATVLELKMGVKGTEFQKTALSYCRESLKEAVKIATGDPASNPHVKLLATKIVYHTQVCCLLAIANQPRSLAFTVRFPSATAGYQRIRYFT